MEPGFFAPVKFEQLMLLDTWTPDGRFIAGEGFGTRDMPRPIYLMDQQSDYGHLGSGVAGRLDEVTRDGNVVSGRGWLLDNERGRLAAMYLSTKSMTGNSVDLADTEAEIVERGDGEDFNIGVKFTKANIGATTIVGIPAFPGATAELEELSRPAAGVEVVGSFASTSFSVATPNAPTVMTTQVPLDWFSGEQARKPYPVTVEANGRVHGYLATWDQAHLSVAGRVKAPRGNGYGYFNASTVLTPDGPAATGPLVIGGDHASDRCSWTEATDHYASTSLAWADVHAQDDRHGIRINGMVRPGTPSEAVHAGRASRLSGDWRRIGSKMELIASLSVSTPAFPVARGFSNSERGGFDSLILFAPHGAVDVQHDVAGPDASQERARQLLAVRNRIALSNLDRLTSQ